MTDAANPVVTDQNDEYWAGSAWVDYDGDGDLDLFVTNRVAGRDRRTNLLYRNEGEGRFTKITSGTSLVRSPGYWFGTSWADYDNDGDLDAFVAGLPSKVYQSNGDGTFQLLTEGLLAAQTLGALSGTWADYDGDGYVDLMLVIADWVQGPPGVGPPQAPRLLHNDGPPTYTFSEVPFVDTEVSSYLHSSWADYDDDGDLDLFIAAGSGEPLSEKLYRNLLKETGNATFERITDTAFVTDTLMANNWNWVDIDNDGDLDLFETNWALQQPQLRPNALYRTDEGTFTRIRTGALVTDADVSENNVWGDYDNDGDLDVIVVNDSLYALRHYKNRGDGTFERVTTGDVAALDLHQSGATVGDYDDDGDLDVYIVGAGAHRALLRNDLDNGNAWLKLRLVGTASNRSAIGATVKVKATIGGQSVWQRRDVSASNSFFGHNSLNVHFGLADATEIDSLVIQWPSGAVGRFANVAVNHFSEVTEGAGMVILTSIEAVAPGRFGGNHLLQNYPNPFHPATRITFSIETHKHVTLAVFDILGREVERLVDEGLSPGTYAMEFDGSELPSGVYVYALQAGALRTARTMTHTK